ncbi:MAG: glycosyltransferase family 2 protein [Methanotrichaceae archaeon]|nr:glycosyltransferase family 2 protein [Methanotrichaceae archaeon]
MQSGHQIEVSLAIPAYNEEHNIARTALGLIDEFERANIPMELVLVDNGSRDNTPLILGDLAKRYPQIKAVWIAVNEGFGWGIINGLKKCEGNYIGFLGADGQIAPEDVVRVVQKLLSENLDLCKVNRTIRNDGLIRIFLSKSFNLLIFLLYGISSRDINGSPKIMRRDCYDKLNLTSKDWFIDSEIMIQASSYGFKIGEVDTEFKNRLQGKSHVKATTIIEFLINLIRYKMVHRYGQR